VEAKMDDDPVGLLTNLVHELRGRFGDADDRSVLIEVSDYLKFGEAQIALELLADQICEYEIHVSRAEFENIFRLAQTYRCQDRKALEFIRTNLIL
jgi:hypothetical protein